MEADTIKHIICLRESVRTSPTIMSNSYMLTRKLCKGKMPCSRKQCGNTPGYNLYLSFDSDLR